MASENELSAFSLRIPKALNDQIEKRAKVNRRSRNAEITFLLEQAIDLNVARDQRLLEEQRKRNENQTTVLA